MYKSIKITKSIILLAIFLPGIIGPFILTESSYTTFRIENVSLDVDNIGLIPNNQDQKIQRLTTDSFEESSKLIPNKNEKSYSSNYNYMKAQSSGYDFDDAIEITMTNGTGNIANKGSVLGEINVSHEWVVYKYSLNDSGPIDLSLKTQTEVDIFQFYFDVFVDQYGFPIGSAFDGNPLLFNYFAPQAGYNYIIVGGFDTNFDDDFDIYNGDIVEFNLSISLIKKGVAPEGAISRSFQSIAYEQIEDIFTFFRTNNYILQNNSIDLLRGVIGTEELSLDPDDPDFYKGIGLSIYGIVRAGDFISSSDNKQGLDKSLALEPYIQMAINLFNLANDSLNVYDGGNDVLYIAPGNTSRATLSSNAYMLLGIGEIVYQASKDIKILNDYNTNLTDLVDWGYTLALSIKNKFENASGYYFEEVSDLGSTNTTGELMYLESMSILAEAFSWLGDMELIVDFNNSIPFPILNPEDIRQRIIDKLLITNDENTTIDLITDTDVGIGVEYWNKASGKQSNVSTLMGNLAYALHRTSQFEHVQSSSITTNILRLFTSPDSNLLVEKKLIVEDGTILPELISTLENTLFILLAQRLENKWKDDFFNSNDDISRSWGRKGSATLSDMFDLLFDNVESAFFGMYDNQAKKLISDDNLAKSNRFVANAFLSTVLVRIFPVQLGVIAGHLNTVDENTEISLELTQISLEDSLNWWDFIITFNFQLTVTISKFNFLQTETVDLADFADFGDSPGEVNSKFLTFVYQPTVKGNYTISIALSVEGRDLLVKEVELTALGIVRAEYVESDLVFSSDDSSFTSKFTLIDENGIAMSNLNTNASLGKSHQNAISSTYVKTGRSDASGKVSIKFDTSSIVKDGIINQSLILSLPVTPNVIYITLYVNITNADSQNLKQAEQVLKIPIKITLAKFYGTFDFSSLQFSTADSEFEGTVTILDEKGVATPNLKIDASLGDPIATSQQQFGNKYITRDVLSDSSGKATFKFDVSSFEQDKIDRSQLSNLNVTPTFLIFEMFLNITTSSSFNYAGDIVVRVKVNLASISTRISPSILEVTQGTTEAFTFIVATLDQDQLPIANAIIHYNILDVPGSSNTVFSNADGEASITLRDNNLFGMSNLALIAEGDTTTNITLTIEHPNYPNKIVTKSITILANSLKINANPVQSNVKEVTFLDPQRPAIDVEVSVEDLFGKNVAAEVSVSWVDRALDGREYLGDLGKHISPYTFSINPSNLPVGEHLFEIIAEKDGITSTVIISGTTFNMGLAQKLSVTNQVPVIDRPVKITRKIVIEQITVQDYMFSIVGILSGLIIAKIFTLGKEQGLILSKRKLSCPNCEEYIDVGIKVCPNCGRDVLSENKDKNESTSSNEDGELNVEKLVLEDETESNQKEETP